MDYRYYLILAVYGLNVAFVAAIFFSILGFFRLPRKAVGGRVAILGLVAEMLITVLSASVVRATIMAIVLLCGTLFERKADIYNSMERCCAAFFFSGILILYSMLGFQFIVRSSYLYCLFLILALNHLSRKFRNDLKK